MIKLISGHYYLQNNGIIFEFLQDFTEETYCTIKSLNNKYAHQVSKDWLKLVVSKDLGNNKEVVQILYSNSGKKEHV